MPYMLADTCTAVQVCDARADAMKNQSRIHKKVTCYLFQNILFNFNLLIKYQYRTKTGYCKCRKWAMAKAIFDVSINEKAYV